MGTQEVQAFLTYLATERIVSGQVYTHVLQRGGLAVKSPLDN